MAKKKKEDDRWVTWLALGLSIIGAIAVVVLALHALGWI